MNLPLHTSVSETFVEPSSRWLRQGFPVCASLILHLSLLSVLALITFSTGTDSSLSTISTEFTAVETPVETLQFEETLFQQESSSSKGDTASLDHTVPSQIVNPRFDASPQASEAIPLSFSPVSATGANLAETVSPLTLTSALSKGSSGDGTTGDGNGTGSGEFFGLNLNGMSVVFVVDASSSMNFPHPGPAKTRFGRVKLELVKTIGKMTDKDQFFMVFFNEFAIPMPANRLVNATPGNQQLYLNWMASGKAGGDTEPEAALHVALKLNPQVIYFLTDGRFKYNVVKSVAAANRAGVVINTFCFGDDQGEKFLKQLAEQNGGVYRFIPDEKEPEKEQPKSSGPTPILKVD